MIDNITKEQIRTHLIKFCEIAGSDKAGSKKLDISNSYVSQIRNNKSDALSDDMWRKLAKKLNVEVAEQWAYAETRQSDSLLKLIEKCRNEVVFRTPILPSGSGKTYTLDRVRLSQPNVFFVKCIEDITRKELYQEILLSMGKPYAKGSTLALLNQMAEEAAKRDNPVLIIDEIEDCHASILRQIKSIYNKLEGICPVIILGTPNLKRRIEALVKRDTLTFKQLYSRMNFVEIAYPNAADAAKIVRAQGITDLETVNKIVNSSIDDIHGGIDFRSVKRLIQREQLLAGKGAAA
jgi:DNA transposition AAA+ family ATPase